MAGRPAAHPEVLCSLQPGRTSEAIMKLLHHVALLLFFCTSLLLCALTPVKTIIWREAEALVNWKASLADADESLGSWSIANSTSLQVDTHNLQLSQAHQRARPY